ncbi:unnamed protein product [Effrenium voratum]|nr:unnamed protein product [Effrenium voratum]
MLGRPFWSYGTEAMSKDMAWQAAAQWWRRTLEAQRSHDSRRRHRRWLLCFYVIASFTRITLQLPVISPYLGLYTLFLVLGLIASGSTSLRFDLLVSLYAFLALCFGRTRQEPTLLEDVEAGVSLASVNYLLSMAIHPICLALNGAWLAWLSNGVVWNLDDLILLMVLSASAHLSLRRASADLCEERRKQESIRASLLAETEARQEAQREQRHLEQKMSCLIQQLKDVSNSGKDRDSRQGPLSGAQAGAATANLGRARDRGSNARRPPACAASVPRSTRRLA